MATGLVLRHGDDLSSQSHQLLSFMKKRQAIEREYSEALSKLVREFSIDMNEAASQATTPNQLKVKRRFSSVLGTIGKAKSPSLPQSEFDFNYDNASAPKSALGQAFLTVVEDTTNQSNLHSKIARSISISIVEPMQLYIKTSEEKMRENAEETLKTHRVKEEKRRTSIEEETRAVKNAQEKAKIMKTFFNKYLLIRSDELIESTEFTNSLSERFSRIDLEEDTEEYAHESNKDDLKRKIENATKIGYLEKREIDSQGWKKRYFVLKSKKLFYFENDSSMKVKGFIDLTKSVVHDLHEDYFSKKKKYDGAENQKRASNPTTIPLGQQNYFSGQFYFQLVSKTDAGNLTTYFSAKSKEEKTEWLSALYQNCFCCHICSELSNTPFIRFTNEQVYRKIKSLKVEIMQAKELPNIDLVRGKCDPYCVVTFDGIEMAKTHTKWHNIHPQWNEVFDIDQVHHDIMNVSVLVLSKSSGLGLRKDYEIGRVHFNLDLMKNGIPKEGWFTLIPSLELHASLPDNVGSLQALVCVKNQTVLSIQDYSKFWSMVIDENMECVNVMSDNLLEREELSQLLLKLFEGSGGISFTTNLVISLLSREIHKTENPTVLFRSSSFATKTCEKFMKRCGETYLINTLKKAVREVLNQKESCEVDPMKLDSDENSKENAERLMIHVQNFWNGIYNSLPFVPQELREVFRAMVKVVDSKNFGDLYKYRAVSGFLFLRFFVPAILSPHIYGICDDTLDQLHSRTLTLIGKTLQTFGNLVQFTSKEAHMQNLTDTFISQQTDNLKLFIDAICEDTPGPAPVPSEKVDLARQLANLHDFLESKRDKLEVVQEKTSALKDLLDVMDTLNNIKKGKEKEHEIFLNERVVRISENEARV